MLTSSNFKNFQATVNQLTVKRTTISSRFRQNSATAKARMIKRTPHHKIPPKPQTMSSDLHEQMTVTTPEASKLRESYPIACPVPVPSQIKEEQIHTPKGRNWFSKLFSLKPETS